MTIKESTSTDWEETGKVKRARSEKTGAKIITFWVAFLRILALRVVDEADIYSPGSATKSRQNEYRSWKLFDAPKE